MKLDARYLIGVQRRCQGVFIKFEMAVQQVALGRIGVAEQHHFGVQPFDRMQHAVGQLKALDHRPFTRPDRGV